MIAAWYDRQGPAAEVLQVGALPIADPGAGEVRVRLGLSGRASIPLGSAGESGSMAPSPTAPSAPPPRPPSCPTR